MIAATRRWPPWLKRLILEIHRSIRTWIYNSVSNSSSPSLNPQHYGTVTIIVWNSNLDESKISVTRELQVQFKSIFKMSIPRSSKYEHCTIGIGKITSRFLSSRQRTHFWQISSLVGKCVYLFTCTLSQGTREIASCRQSEYWEVWSCQQNPRRCRGRLDGLPHCRSPPGTTTTDVI